jgi:hypothetical protein
MVGVRLSGSDGACCRTGRGDIPRQQVRDAVHGMIGDAREGFSQIRFEIDSCKSLEDLLAQSLFSVPELVHLDFEDRGC